MGIKQDRASNAHKLNTHYLYSKPYRAAIPALQIILFILAWTILGLGSWTDSLYTDNQLLHISDTVFIPVFLIIYHPTEFIRRYQRRTTPIETTVSSTIILLLWIAYSLIGVFTYSTKILALIFAAPAIIPGAIYLGFAADALRREQRAAKMPKRDVELAEQQLPSYEAFAAGAGSSTTRPGLSRMNTSQEGLVTVDVQPEKQKWSPLGGF